MRAIIWQIKTDHEGESRITFSVPLSEIASVVQLNTMLEKELELTVKESKQGSNRGIGIE